MDNRMAGTVVGHLYLSLYKWPRLWVDSRQTVGRIQTGRPGFYVRCHQIPSEYTRSGVAIYRKEVQPVSGSGNLHSFPLGRTRQQQVALLEVCLEKMVCYCVKKGCVGLCILRRSDMTIYDSSV
ncbi:hypothetical protein TNCV_2398861 [Trichonephila clavipes]|uniref:Uncharacterized protein n=1 Tax=Trichonephila clavipes TaxID=2585209 RepID=A0A8X6SUU4_TRICX|nr:hypothetical protein TNCV_2398861 [Trichonephila clavipes]